MPKSQFKPGAEPSAILDYYAAQSAFPSAGRHAALLKELPADAAEAARLVHGLVLYEHIASDFYDTAIPIERRGESHIRHLERMLDTLLVLNNAPLCVSRPPPERIVGVCHHFMLMAVALLRIKASRRARAADSELISIRATSRTIGSANNRMQLRIDGYDSTRNSIPSGKEIFTSSMTCSTCRAINFSPPLMLGSPAGKAFTIPTSSASNLRICVDFGSLLAA